MGSQTARDGALYAFVSDLGEGKVDRKPNSPRIIKKTNHYRPGPSNVRGDKPFQPLFNVVDDILSHNFRGRLSLSPEIPSWPRVSLARIT